MVKIFMPKAVVYCFDEPVFFAFHPRAIGRGRMRCHNVLERSLGMHLRAHAGRYVIEHGPISDKFSASSDRPVCRNDPRMVVRHCQSEVDRPDKALNRSAAAPVDEREDVVEEYLSLI